MRYVPHTDEDRQAMLETIGVATMGDLFAPVPGALRAPPDVPFPARLSEPELLRELTALARKNRPISAGPSFLGGGAYHHYISPVVDAICSRGEFLTAYTPYQAECSQGTLQAIFEFQSIVSELTGLPVANASMYDAASGLAEALSMLRDPRAARKGTPGRVVLSGGVHPEYVETVRTYFRSRPIEVEVLPLGEDARTDPDAFAASAEGAYAVAFQSPTFLGTIEDARALTTAAHGQSAKVVQVFSPIATALLTTPGEAGADVAVGEGQPLGVPLSFGGPYLGLFATTSEHVRRLPGRLVGQTVDRRGRRAYVLTLQTREQHIRREKATSNICTNVGLMALRACIHTALLGPEGLRQVARLSFARAHQLAERVCSLPGFALRYPGAPFFHEVAIALPLAASEVDAALAARGITGGLDLGRFDPADAHTMLFACTELTTGPDLDALVEALSSLGDAQ